MKKRVPKKKVARRTAKRRQNKLIEQRLTDLEREMKSNIRHRLGNVHNTSDQKPVELLDKVASGEMDYMSACAAESGSQVIDEIELALRKLHGGTYGVCEGCAKRIKKRRLRARPFATLCITCKHQQELYGYVDRTATVPNRGGAGITVNLQSDDVVEPDDSFNEIFRGISDLEIKEMM